MISEQLNLRRLDDGNGGYIIKIRAGLPRCWERNKTEELKQLFERILEKAGEDEHNSLAFSTEEMQNWNLLSFYESLLLEVWKVFKTPERYKPVFIELCNPNPNEYKAANYHCHQLISTVMEKEIGKFEYTVFVLQLVCLKITQHAWMNLNIILNKYGLLEENSSNMFCITAQEFPLLFSWYIWTFKI